SRYAEPRRWRAAFRSSRMARLSGPSGSPAQPRFRMAKSPSPVPTWRSKRRASVVGERTSVRSLRQAPRSREAPQQTISLFDHRVGTREQRRRNFDAQRLGCLQVDDQVVVLGRCLHRKVGWLLAPGYAIDVAGRAPELQIRRVGHQAAAGDHADVGWTRHQLVRQPAAMFFSAAYFAAASLTMGAITLSSLTYQADEIWQLLAAQVWMRPVRAPSWSAHDTLTGLSTFSKPSSLKRSALMSRFSKPQRTCSPVIGFLPNFSCAVRIA